MYFFYFHCIGRSISVDFGDLKIGVFMGYSRSIQGVFTGYSYVSVMCRLCIGYVSVMYRNRHDAKK